MDATHAGMEWKNSTSLVQLGDNSAFIVRRQASGTVAKARGSAGESDHDTPGRPCSLWRRMLAMSYDAAVVTALLMAATALAMLAGFRELNVVRDPLYALYLLAVWFAYFGWCWHRGGMTLGMRAWRIRIITVEGGLPGRRRCLARFALGFVSAAAAGAGFLWSLVDREKCCWHARLPGTRLYRC